MRGSVRKNLDMLVTETMPVRWAHAGGTARKVDPLRQKKTFWLGLSHVERGRRRGAMIATLAAAKATA